jgi:hypothetical protein
MRGNLAPMTDLSTPITTARPRPLLRVALKLDAVVTGANGAAYLAAAAPLSDLLGLSETLLRATGGFLLVYAALVWLTATRRAIPRGPVYAIVAANAIWAIDGIVVAIAGWGDPTTTGTVWIVLQAIVVAAFAELQLTGLKRKDG